ncbi:MAG: GNAT family N-acetyltransferase [Myxococcota bacterium]
MVERIRPLVRADLAVVRAITDAAGLTGAADNISRYLAWQPDGYRVLERDGVVVACVGAVRFGRTAFVGAMAVLPSEQRRGYGRRALERLLTELDHEGMETILLEATDAGTPLYRQLGFVVDHETYAYRLESPRAHGDPLPGIPTDALDEVVAFDASHFGAVRRDLLVGMWREHPERSAVVRRGGRVVAYGMCTRTRLGPVVAEAREDAERLMDTLLLLPRDPLMAAHAPLPNEHAHALLTTRGFHQVRRLRRMRRGGHPLGNPGAIYTLVNAATG